MENSLDFGPVDYTGTNDYVAKKIWEQPRHFKSLVYKTLGIRLDEEKIEYISNEDKKLITGKGNRYDIIVKYGDDLRIIAETQNTPGSKKGNGYSDKIINRSLHYISSVHTMLYEEGEDYRQNKYTYLIWVCNFVIPNQEGISIFSFKNESCIEFDRMKIVFVSLPNIGKDAKIDISTKDFFSVLNTKDLSVVNPTDQEAIELAKTIRHINTDADEKLLAKMAELNEITRLTEHNAAIEEGREEGLELGREEGREEERIKMTEENNKANASVIRGLLERGMPLEAIAELYNKPVAEINDLLEKY